MAKFKRDKLKIDVEDDTEQELFTQLHPLYIPEILEMVFNYFGTIEELKIIRAVSKAWMKESLRKWRSSFVLVLKPEVINVLINAYLHKKKAFLQLFETPFQNFRFPENFPRSLKHFPLKASSSCRRIRILWEQFLVHARFINLGDCLLENFLGGFQWILKSCPELKSLDFNPHHSNSTTKIRWTIPNDANEGITDDLSDDDHSFSEDSSSSDEDNYIDCSSSDSDDDNDDNRSEIRASLFDMELEAEWQSQFEVVRSGLESLSIGRSNNARFLKENGAFLDISCYNDFHVECEAEDYLMDLINTVPKLKNLWTHGGCIGKGLNSSFLQAATLKSHKLQSISILTLRRYEKVDLAQLETYLEKVSPPLKCLVLMISWDDWFQSVPEEINPRPLLQVIYHIQETISKLELFIDLKDNWDGFNGNPVFDLSNGGQWEFPNLTHLKLSLCYKTFQQENRLILFDFKSLRYMKNLKVFHFETGLNVASEWVRRKLGVEDLTRNQNRQWFQFAPDNKEEINLSYLKKFHCHNNFTSEAIQLLAKWTPGLETLEVVLDKENFSSVLKAWSNLKQITLLPGSEVPRKMFSGPKKFKPKQIVLNRSEDYQEAVNNTDGTNMMKNELDRRLQLSCFKTKAHQLCKI